MSKFKAGDKVRLSRGGAVLSVSCYKSDIVWPEKTYTVVGTCGCEIALHGVSSIFNQDYFELAEFTKDDLKDGMRVTHEDGTETIVVGDELWVTRSENYKKHGYHINLARYHDDLTGCVGTGFSIEKVTDRDGTVLFEREPEKRTVTLELTDEQIESLKAQGVM